MLLSIYKPSWNMSDIIAGEVSITDSSYNRYVFSYQILQYCNFYKKLLVLQYCFIIMQYFLLRIWIFKLIDS